MSDTWMALPAGLIIATLATLVGIGGGVLWMPYLIFVAHLNPTQAVVTSLVIQVCGLGSGSVTVIKTKKTGLRLPLFLAIGAFPGVPIGVWMSKVVPPDSIGFILGVACLVIGLVFVYAQEEPDTQTSQVSLRRTAPYLWLATLFAVITGFLSMGVGDFFVPILRNRLRMSMESAMGGCLILMTMNAALAASIYILIGERFATNIVLWAIPGVLLGGQIGPRLAGRISDQTLKEIFIYGLSIAGIHMMFNIPSGQ
jgi:uncharacterized membrane protein YfcA